MTLKPPDLIEWFFQFTYAEADARKLDLMSMTPAQRDAFIWEVLQKVYALVETGEVGRDDVQLLAVPGMLPQSTTVDAVVSTLVARGDVEQFDGGSLRSLREDSTWVDLVADEMRRRAESDYEQAPDA
jgi:hypothetical protein